MRFALSIKSRPVGVIRALHRPYGDHSPIIDELYQWKCIRLCKQHHRGFIRRTMPRRSNIHPRGICLCVSHTRAFVQNLLAQGLFSLRTALVGPSSTLMNWATQGQHPPSVKLLCTIPRRMLPSIVFSRACIVCLLISVILV